MLNWCTQCGTDNPRTTRFQRVTSAAFNSSQRYWTRLPFGSPDLLVNGRCLRRGGCAAADLPATYAPARGTVARRTFLPVRVCGRMMTGLSGFTAISAYRLPTTHCCLAFPTGKPGWSLADRRWAWAASRTATWATCLHITSCHYALFCGRQTGLACSNQPLPSSPPALPGAGQHVAEPDLWTTT